MSQNPLMHSANQLSKTPSLKAPLAAALAGMEVQLDRELARYRRTRTGGYRASNQSSSYASTSFVSLQHLATLSATPPEDVADSISSDDSTEIPLPENVTPLTYTNEIPLPPPPPPPPRHPDVTVTKDPVKETATPSQSSGSIVPVATIKASKDESIEPSNEPSTTQNQPNDYLESSEALLRSLTEETPKAQKRPTSNSDTLLSPLGIGSILLLLMASVILGYVVINPKSLPQFSLGGLFKPNNSTPTNTDIDSQSSNGNTKTVAQPQLTRIPKYPDLTKEEFPEVKTPNDVVGLTPKPKTTPTVPLQTRPSTSTVIVPPSPVPTQDTPASVTPSPTSTPTQDIPISDLKPSSDGFYHVVIDNKGENAFAAARKIVPDAYLSPDGKLIYLGAVKNKEKVQELLTEIRAKGLDARVK